MLKDISKQVNVIHFYIHASSVELKRPVWNQLWLKPSKVKSELKEDREPL